MRKSNEREGFETEMALTDRNIDVLRAIVDFKRAHGGAAPTVRDLMAILDVRSTSVIRHHLERLEKIGLIKSSVDGERLARIICLPGERYTAPAHVAEMIGG